MSTTMESESTALFPDDLVWEPTIMPELVLPRAIELIDRHGVTAYKRHGINRCLLQMIAHAHRQVTGETILWTTAGQVYLRTIRYWDAYAENDRRKVEWLRKRWAKKLLRKELACLS